MYRVRMHIYIYTYAMYVCMYANFIEHSSETVAWAAPTKHT